MVTKEEAEAFLGRKLTEKDEPLDSLMTGKKDKIVVKEEPAKKKKK